MSSSDEENEEFGEVFEGEDLICNSLTTEELDKVICEKKRIVVRREYDCFCWIEKGRETDYYIIQSKSGKITERMIVEKLIKSKHDPKCDHCFYEGTSPTSLEDVFDLNFGS